MTRERLKPTYIESIIRRTGARSLIDLHIMQFLIFSHFSGSQTSVRVRYMYVGVRMVLVAVPEVISKLWLFRINPTFS